MPRVTSIIPLYNASATVAGTLDSLRRQTRPDWCAIVVNDGSTDDGPAIVRAVARAEPRITLVNRPNGGLPAARNTGIDAAPADGYLHFLDADDSLPDTAFASLLAAAESSALGAAYGPYTLHDEHNFPLAITAPVPGPVLTLNHFLDHNPLVSHSHLLRRDLLGDDRFDESLPVAEDYDLWLRLAGRGIRWAAVHDPVAAYRIRPASMSKDFGAMLRTTQSVVRAAYRRGVPCSPDHALSRACSEDEPRKALGASAPSPTLSSSRLASALTSIALAFATRAALLDPSTTKDHAARLLTDADGPKRLDPESAAAAAYSAVVYGLGRRPDPADPESHVWLSALHHWWRRCAAEGWASPTLADGALRRLARLIVQPAEIADALLDRCEPARPITVIGYGNNGRLLARRAADRGLSVAVVDDDPAVHSDPVHPVATLILTPSNDAALLPRFPHALRWRTARHALAGRAHDALVRQSPAAA